MIEVAGDIWDFELTHWIAIPTNQGWNALGENIMGRGLAQQAAKRYPQIAKIYGQFCQIERGVAQVMPIRFSQAWLLMFPTKALNPTSPSMSWKGKSSIELIEKTAVDLRSMDREGRKVALPALGCGLGGLSLTSVLQMLHRSLPGDDFVFVRQAPF